MIFICKIIFFLNIISKNIIMKLWGSLITLYLSYLILALSLLLSSIKNILIKSRIVTILYIFVLLTLFLLNTYHGNFAIHIVIKLILLASMFFSFFAMFPMAFFNENWPIICSIIELILSLLSICYDYYAMKKGINMYIENLN